MDLVVIFILGSLLLLYAHGQVQRTTPPFPPSPIIFDPFSNFPQGLPYKASPFFLSAKRYFLSSRTNKVVKTVSLLSGWDSPTGKVTSRFIRSNTLQETLLMGEMVALWL